MTKSEKIIFYTILIIFLIFFSFQAGRYYQYNFETPKVLRIGLYFEKNAEKMDTVYYNFPIIPNVKDTMIVDIYYPTIFLPKPTRR